jgi:perosamine synthetase
VSDDGFIPFHRASIGDKERAAVDEVLQAGWITTGDRAQMFEERFAACLGSRNAVALNSATAALHLALEGLGVGPDDEVVVPTYTFAASAEVALYLGARPVLVDIDEQTLNISPEHAISALTDRTRAIEVVHVAGLPADVPSLTSAVDANRTDIPVVEDAAHAFPSPVASAGGRFAGTFGAVGAFSFYATKTITTAEGGMLVTDDDALGDRARSMRLHGLSRDAWKRHTATGSWFYEVVAAGYKYNLTDIAAALGLVQLERAWELKAARARIARLYLDGLAALASAGRLILPDTGDDPEAHAWHLFVVRLTESTEPDRDAPGVDILPPDLRGLATKRSQVIVGLRDRGVGTSVHFIPLHLHPLYREMGYRAGAMPVAERAYAGAISLPIWPGMTDGQIEHVVEALTDQLA